VNKRLALIATALFAFFISACAETPAAVVAAAPAASRLKVPLILISIDGFRWDYLTRGVSPTLVALADDGVRAERLIPSYPSVTFPNHYTLVTGLYPDHHGVIANTFEDPGLAGVFHMTTKDEAWWDEGTPLWVTAERQGVSSASEFWPGSEAAIHGVRPGRWERFNGAKAADARVDAVLRWLDAPLAARPRFLTLYFNAVDTAGHLYGPDSPEVNAAIASTDAAVGRLVAGLRVRGITANLIIVADHGMAAVAPERTLVLDDMVDPAIAHIAFTGAEVGASFPKTTAGLAERGKLLAHHDHMTCWPRQTAPERLHYGKNPRIPDVFCAVAVGWMAETREEIRLRPKPLRGEHGYDPSAQEMGALFIAQGPAFARGKVVRPFPNVDVYPLMVHVLGVHGTPSDGNLEDVRAVLAP